MQRFKYWVVLLVGSILLVGSSKALNGDVRNESNGNGGFGYGSDDDGVSDWVFISERNSRAVQSPFFISSALISTTITFLGIIVCILRQNRYTYMIETVLVFSETALWCFFMVTLIFVSFYNAERTSLQIQVAYPQLYFTSWGLTIVSIMNFASWLKQNVYGENLPTATQWVLLVAMGAFFSLSAIAFSNQHVEDVDPVTGVVNIYRVCETAAYSCASLSFAVAVGTATAVVAGCFLPYKNAPLKCQADIAMFLIIAWSCGVAIITFPPGPGVSMGNLYFGSWGCFLLTLRILAVSTSADDEIKGNSTRLITTTGNENEARVVDRMDILNVAYDQLENLAQFGGEENVRAESGSCFSSVEGSWSFVDRLSVNGGTIRSLSAVEQEMSPSPRVVERNRLELWAIQAVISSVCLASLFLTLPDKYDSEDWERLELALPSVSIALATFGFLSCMAAYRKLEIILICLSVVTWGLGVPFLSNVDADSAGGSTVTDYLMSSANVFFASLGSFFVSLILATSWFQASVITTDWIILSVSSGVLALSSYFSLTQDVNVEGDDGTITQVPFCSTIVGDEGCDTVRYAIYLGMASAIVSITMVFTTICRFPVLFHVFMACLVLGAWVWGVATITYDNGHGSTASFAFFIVWICFILALDIASTNTVLYFAEKDQKNGPRNEGGNEPEQERATEPEKYVNSGPAEHSEVKGQVPIDLTAEE